MRLPSWLRQGPTRRTGPRTVVVTLTADTTQFVAAMAGVRIHLEDRESLLRYYLRIEEQRLMGLLYVEGLLDDWCAELGIDRPVS